MANNNDKKVLNVPALRFPEFTEEWQGEQLHEIAELSKGIGISKEQLSENGTPCILYGELYTKYKSEIISKIISKTDIEKSKLKHSKQNDVIIPCSGETAIDIAVARCVPFDNVLLGGDMNVIRLHKYDGAFMAYQLNGKRKTDIAKLAQGVSVVHLYGENLKSIKTYNPSLQEQQKIVKLLSMLDERLEVQNKIIEDLKKLKSAISKHLFARKDLLEYTSNPQPIGFSGILLAKRQNSFYCTYFLHNRNVADTKSPYPIKRLEVIRWFNQKSMVFNQSLS